MAQSDLIKKHKHDPIKVLALRWVVINNRLNLYNTTNNYLRVRYEDLFHEDIAIAFNTIKRIRKFFQLEPIELMDYQKFIKTKINKSNSRPDTDQLINDNEEFILKHTQDLRELYNYV